MTVDQIPIGRFSVVTSLSLKALRYYDEKGILVPKAKDPFTGYRYYTGDQIAVGVKISTLTGLGFSLEETAGILEAEEPSYTTSPPVSINCPTSGAGTSTRGRGPRCVRNRQSRSGVCIVSHQETRHVDGRYYPNQLTLAVDYEAVILRLLDHLLDDPHHERPLGEDEWGLEPHRA